MKLVDALKAESGSFLLELRTDLNWNHSSFINLLTELNTECKRTKENPNFPKQLVEEYYEKAYELINDLTYSYFMAESPYESESEIENKIAELKTFYNNA